MKGHLRDFKFQSCVAQLSTSKKRLQNWETNFHVLILIPSLHYTHFKEKQEIHSFFVISIFYYQNKKWKTGKQLVSEF